MINLSFVSFMDKTFYTTFEKSSTIIGPLIFLLFFSACSQFGGLNKYMIHFELIFK